MITAPKRKVLPCLLHRLGALVVLVALPLSQASSPQTITIGHLNQSLLLEPRSDTRPLRDVIVRFHLVLGRESIIDTNVDPSLPPRLAVNGDVSTSLTITPRRSVYEVTEPMMEIDVRQWDSHSTPIYPDFYPRVVRITTAQDAALFTHNYDLMPPVTVGVTTLSNEELLAKVGSEWYRFPFDNPPSQRPNSWLTSELLKDEDVLPLRTANMDGLLYVREQIRLGALVMEKRGTSFAPVRPFVQAFHFDRPSATVQERVYRLRWCLHEYEMDPRERMVLTRLGPEFNDMFPIATSAHVYHHQELYRTIYLQSGCPPRR